MRREKFIGEEEIKHLFQNILGADINIKDNLKQTEETVFCLFVKKLEESKIIEDKVFENPDGEKTMSDVLEEKETMAKLHMFNLFNKGKKYKA